MYAILDINGQQFKVAENQNIYVHRQQEEEGSSIEFDGVLLLDNDGDIKVGAPTVEGAKVTAKVVAHTRGEKVKVFKKKRRKGYQKETGHRDDLTQLQIEAITTN
ncbi:MAG: 50S ribosomal protein L21 [Bacteroidales bacterium]|nr:50S ribosomal protein L21 [Bacteroidales bacterium]MCF8338615.1 50S ribosomal protein L21 [Bacteroidales bacterium]